MRLPAYPLIVHDPYFSIWSAADHLAQARPSHWTGKDAALTGFVRIDGQVRRFMDCINTPQPQRRSEEYALHQEGVEVTATRTIYTFRELGVELKLTFLTPALPSDLNILSRPLSYVLFDVQSLDGAPHDVTILWMMTPQVLLNEMGAEVSWGRYRHPKMDILTMGVAHGLPLSRSGDGIKTDWGSLYVALPIGQEHQSVIGDDNALLEAFFNGEALTQCDAMDSPRQYSCGWPAMAVEMTAKLSPATVAKRFTLGVAYNDIASVEYLGRKLYGYWQSTGQDFAAMLEEAMAQLPELEPRCQAFDRHFQAETCRAGGKEYALLCQAAYRQALGAHKLVANIDGTPLYFSKENHSNGCIATVDVTYPSAPLYLWLMPELLKGMLLPILEYASLPRWRFPYAPHDLGTFPLANGQVYGGGERTERDQMPVEECGNMLILCAALQKFHPQICDFIDQYWELLTQWAEYLSNAGYDPANQLCTDDFAGHLAHNTNLSLKAIIALGAYHLMAEERHHDHGNGKYLALAREFAQRWCKDAFDGDHYRLAFDQPGSWSQKYNLVWDELLELQLFPESVAATEVEFYLKKLNEYGLPLDNREKYTKIDWEIWVASLTKCPQKFQQLLAPVIKWLQEGVSRVPITDFYYTHQDGRMVFFQARSVVGGLFLPLLQKGRQTEP